MSDRPRWLKWPALVAAVAASVIAIPAPALADEVSDGQWYVSALHLDKAHQITDGAGVTVAVVDYGVDATHPTLAGRVLPGADFSTNDTTSTGDGRTDADGHGTGMASLIAGHGRIAGVAPGAKILPIKIGTGGGRIGVASGIRWAVDHGAKVISMSVGANVADPRERAAVEYALAHDVVVVAAVGNAPEVTKIQYPARYPGVVASCATDRNGNHAAVSLTGPEVLLCAPGDKVSSAYLHHNYSMDVGTSDSTALIAGVAALVRAKFPQISGVDVVGRLTSTATDKGTSGRDDLYGFGIVNPEAALTAATVTKTPSRPPASPGATQSQANEGSSGPLRLAVIACVVVAIVAIAALVIWLVVMLRRRGRR